MEPMRVIMLLERPHYVASATSLHSAHFVLPFRSIYRIKIPKVLTKRAEQRRLNQYIIKKLKFNWIYINNINVYIKIENV